MKREQRTPTLTGQSEGPVTGRESGAVVAALRLQPPAVEIEFDRLEWLGTHALGAGVGVGDNRVAVLQSGACVNPA